ncbi:MAG: DUF4395 domain-containing protein [Ramlibacter sp.]
MTHLLQFGETVEGYDIPVLNERAVRAAAGILFFLALVSFMNAWLAGNFQPTRVFVVAFLIDFVVRIFVNPKLAPSLIAGQFMVRRQVPEYTGAPQKRFAWSIGFALALAMFYLVVVRQVVGPANILVCAACLVLLFFESAFGICIGCKVYNLFNREQARLCPGGVCDPRDLPARHRLGLAHFAVVGLFIAAVWGAAPWVAGEPPPSRAGPVAADIVAPTVTAAEAQRCKVPDFAVAMGHVEKWKLHNNCK